MKSICPTCEGDGRATGDDGEYVDEDCPSCHGEGEVDDVSE